MYFIHISRISLWKVYSPYNWSDIALKRQFPSPPTSFMYILVPSSYLIIFCSFWLRISSNNILSTSSKFRQQFFLVHCTLALAHSIPFAFLSYDSHLVLVLEIDPHVVFGVILEKVDFNLTYFTLQVGFAELDDSCLKPPSNRMINVDSVVEADGFGAIPLLEDPARMNADELIVLGVPASVMDEDFIVFDAENLGVEPEVDFVESVYVLANKKCLTGGLLDFHEYWFNWVFKNKCKVWWIDNNKVSLW